MRVDLSNNRFCIGDAGEQDELLRKAEDFYERLHGKKGEFEGWVDLPCDYDEHLLRRIERTAEEIKDKCSLLIVVGIGGSYLGAKAVIDALNGSKPDWPEVRFVGYHMNGAYIEKLKRRIKEQSVCLVAISKSGNTTEPMLAYAILKEIFYAKYGATEASKRIYIITGQNKGFFRREAETNGFTTFDVPEDIGGRYSVLTVVGLLPIAVAGHNIREIIRGAATIASSRRWRDELIHYAASRKMLFEQGKELEIFEYFNVNLRYFGEWLKQLFGESEGKDSTGIYPTCLCFTRDLHSMGQFIQQGHQIFFETMIRIKEYTYDFEIPEGIGEPFSGKTLEYINDCAEEGVVIAHAKADIPINIIEIDRLDEYNMGELIYFFEMSCAISALNFGVDPFNQPGVEEYKSQMKRLVTERDFESSGYKQI